MKKLLVVVDYQNDFVSGSLAFPSSSAYEPRIASLIGEFVSGCDDVAFTRDVHDEGYLHTEEGRHLPVIHCQKGTDGALFYGGIENISSSYPVFEKDTFGSAKLFDYIRGKSYGEIVLVGLDLSICVFANAVLAKSAAPDARIVVDISASGSGDAEAEHHAIEAMKRLQIDVRDLSKDTKGLL
jgi:nicotinamidase/pyrazinamidase